MSWDFHLRDPVTGEEIQFDQPHFMRGGTYAVGGTYDAHFNVTYNYGKVYRRHNGNVPFGSQFDGKVAHETIPILEEMITKLGDDVSADYWEATEGNAKRALHALLALAKMRPDGVWDVC